MSNWIARPELKLIGFEIRTSNDHWECLKDIPMAWKQFTEDKILDRIPNKRSNEIVSLYTNYENVGKNCEGRYSMILGTWVDRFERVPVGLVEVIIQPASYRVFPVIPPSPDEVGRVWQSIWKAPVSECPRAFLADFDVYDESGNISVWVGVQKYG